MNGIPNAPVFRPTEEEWRIDPLVYIQRIRQKCSGYGICKVIPPPSWKPEFSMHVDKKLIATRVQRIDRLGAHKRAKENPVDKEKAAGPDTGASTSTNSALPEVKKRKYKPKKCVSCLSPTDQAKMAWCSECGFRTHIYCLTPPLLEPPEDGSWTCSVCIEFKKQSFGFGHGEQYNLHEYKNRGDSFKRDWFNIRKGQNVDTAVSRTFIEKTFWSIVHKGSPKVEVEYGSELDVTELGSGFPRTGEFGSHPWNLNNIGRAKGSVLRHLDDIAGITIPWLYVGMCFSSFCWHNEDHYCYSISYNHTGAPKQWYGIPGKCAPKFEEMMRETYPDLFERQPDLLFQLVTLVSPQTLKKHGVSVCKATHSSGEFIVTFPQAYHAGFNYGFNVAEAVNFACPDWVSWGLRAVEHYRNFRRIPVFSHDELLVRIALNKPGMETCAWIRENIERLFVIERNLRSDLYRRGLTIGARWPEEPKKAEETSQKAPKPRKRKYRNVVHKNDAKNGEGGRKKGILPEVSPFEVGGFDMEAKGGLGEVRERCLHRLRKAYGEPNGNTEDNCAYCKYPCYLSAVFCPCSPNLVCLKHAEKLCSCSLGKKHIRYRFSLWELQEVSQHTSQTFDNHAQASEQKVIAIHNESRDVFNYEDVPHLDKKALLTIDSSQSAMAEEWAANVEKFLNRPDDISREDLQRLLQEARKFIWGVNGEGLHPARKLCEKLVRYEALMQEVSKLLKAKDLKAQNARSMEKDKRPTLTHAKEVCNRVVSELPFGLRDRGICLRLQTVLSDIEKIAEAVRKELDNQKPKIQHFAPARRSGRTKERATGSVSSCVVKMQRPEWTHIKKLLKDARSAMFKFSELHVLSNTMEPVRAWLRPYNELIRDAEINTCFVSTRTQAMMVTMAVPGVNRPMKRERRKQDLPIDDLITAVKAAKSRSGRMTIADCKSLISAEGKLPVRLVEEVRDLKCLITSAETFVRQAKAALTKEKKVSPSVNQISQYLSFVNGIDPTNPSTGVKMRGELEMLIGKWKPLKKAKLTTTGEEEEVENALVDYLRKCLDVALITPQAEFLNDRLTQYFRWRTSVVEFLLKLKSKNCCSSGWSKAEELLKTHAQLRLPSCKAGLALRHILTWRAWAHAASAAINANPCSLPDLEALRSISETLRIVTRWLPDIPFKGGIHEQSGVDEGGERLVELLTLIHEARKFQTRCSELVDSNPPNILTITDLRSILNEIKEMGFRGVGEEKVEALLRKGLAWIVKWGSTKRELKVLEKWMLPYLEEHAKTFVSKVDGEKDNYQKWTKSTLEELLSEANSLHMDVGYTSELRGYLEEVNIAEGRIAHEIKNNLGMRLHGYIVKNDCLQNKESIYEVCRSLMSDVIPTVETVMNGVEMQVDTPVIRRFQRICLCIQTILALNKRVSDSEFAKAANDFERLGMSLEEEKEHSLLDEIEVFEYMQKGVQKTIEAVKVWKRNVDKETKLLTSIPRLEELRRQADSLPLTMPNLHHHVTNRIRKAHAWLTEAKKAFPDVFRSFTLGLPNEGEASLHSWNLCNGEFKLKNPPLDKIWEPQLTLEAQTQPRPTRRKGSLDKARKLMEAGHAIGIRGHGLEDIVKVGKEIIGDIEVILKKRPRYLRIKYAIFMALMDASVVVGDETRRKHYIQMVEERFGKWKQDETGQEVYCLCRRPMKKNSKLICCDTCEEWFHNHCVNLTVNQVTALAGGESKFHCPKCCRAQDKPYPYGSPVSSVENIDYEKLCQLWKRYSDQELIIPEVEMIKLLLDLYHPVAKRFQESLWRATQMATEISARESDKGLVFLDAKPYPKLYLYPDQLIRALDQDLKTVARINLKLKTEFEARLLIWKSESRKILASERSPLEDYENLLTIFTQLRSRSSCCSPPKPQPQPQPQLIPKQEAKNVSEDHENRSKGVDMICEEKSTGEDHAKMQIQMQEEKEKESEHKEGEQMEGRKGSGREDSGRGRRSKYKRRGNKARAKSTSSAKRAKKEQPKEEQRSKAETAIIRGYENVVEVRVVASLVHRARRVRGMVRRGLKDNWKPGSVHGIKFLNDLALVGNLINMPEAEELKAQVMLYCVCQSPYVEGEFMIGCEGGCEDWFHPKCVGIAKDQIPESYVCSACSLNIGA
ncbi:hypothetical protein AAMO2058_000668000 [Amorphochlora amoebiformis]|uniref:[Histone H3]-trimethyl-L-lysine(4) demethylase n=1 Tax=Amorphochlora amoebiformis TaxID=1561963 RepID=A0A7S0DND4_9EUKA|mmetsp:Transcript_35499/g.57297  ORF Transcript_35499/g.57297 Transcript_35499/m.57297 type:complete len:2127 (+) Transcript_35499:36-6416(+)